MYEVGDKVKIRAWDDMVKEFGVNHWGSIKCNHGFVKDMKEHCGEVLTINDIRNDCYDLRDVDGNVLFWTWDECMFEKGSV